LLLQRHSPILQTILLCARQLRPLQK
jgi:hypothetical protein